MSMRTHNSLLFNFVVLFLLNLWFLIIGGR